MKEHDDIVRYEQAAALLPVKYQRMANRLPDKYKHLAEEIRLRSGFPMTVLLPEGEITAGDTKEIVQPADLEQLCDRITEYSRYAAAETIARGFVTAQGGYRVGLCGTVVVQENGRRNLRQLSSAVIRIGKEKIGVGDSVLPCLFDGERFCSTVIIAPPGAGKTTLLRDLIHSLSDGGEQRALRVGLVDERSEIAAMYHGRPQFSVGCHTDVLDGCPKAIGMEMLLRCANPQVIAVDEITAQEDLRLLQQSAHSGVALLATLHAVDAAEARKKPLFGKLLRMGVFERAVYIDLRDGRRTYCVESL